MDGPTRGDQTNPFRPMSCESSTQESTRVRSSANRIGFLRVARPCTLLGSWELDCVQNANCTAAFRFVSLFPVARGDYQSHRERSSMVEVKRQCRAARG